MSTVTCAVLLIGNEILSGRTQDTNLNHIARRTADVGIQVKECRTVVDDIDVIVRHLNELRAAYDYVFTTGGIGPTHDDMTTAAVAKTFGVDVVRDKNVQRAFEDHYGDNLNPASLKMADFPEGAQLIINPATVAPGFYIGNVYCFAGIPRIMQAMLEAVLPLLRQGDKVYTKCVDAFTSESAISPGLEQIQNGFPTVELGSYPFKVGERGCTSLVGRSTDINLLEKAFLQVEKLLDELGAEKRA